jgi:N-acetylglucosamine-6-sulfatase
MNAPPRFAGVRSLCLAGLVLGSAAVAPRLVAAPRPNVVVILTDDMRWDAMSCAGHPFFRTPNLDRLAAEGARFANAFVTTSLCSPSRASFLSGRYARAHGVLNNFTEYPVDLPSYPRRLKEVGYETAYIGKWHMGETNDLPRPGFDHWMSHRGQGNYFDNEFNADGVRRTVAGYYTTVITDSAVAWLRLPHPRPFLLILGHKAPHGGPIQPEPRFEHALDEVPISRPPNADAWNAPDKPAWLRESYPTWHGLGGPLYGQREYDRFVRAYLATLLSVDESVGRVYAALRETGQLDRTVIVFTSDNGFVLGEHGRVDKRTMYEPSIRVPLLVRYPPLAHPGNVITNLVLSLDLAPSLLDLCQAKPLPAIQGRSWRRLLQGRPTAWRSSLLYEYNYEQEFPYTPNVRGVRTAEWKFIRYPRGDGSPDPFPPELYDLRVDHYEQHNLANDPRFARERQRLERELRKLSRKAGPDRMPVYEGIVNVLPKY